LTWERKQKKAKWVWTKEDMENAQQLMHKYTFTLGCAYCSIIILVAKDTTFMYLFSFHCMTFYFTPGIINIKLKQRVRRTRRKIRRTRRKIRYT
jgi:hypothetical protein